jgi:hypothetical protein
MVLAGIPGKPTTQTGFSALTYTTSPPTGLLGVGLGGVALSKTTVDANDLTIDPLALRTHEKCNQAGYVFWRAQATQWR